MGSGNSHPYQACRDPDCDRYACRVWKEAFAEGYRDGREDGYRAGYEVGHADGIRDCPRSHGGG